VNSVLRTAVVLLLLGRSLFSQSTIPVGSVVPKVSCVEPSQSYALYLPSSYSAKQKWPILYVFDPAARGERAVAVIKAAAEKFGYIVAASNNSRNGPLGGSTEAANAMWKDTQQRFAIDERRRYLAGMSGGSRVATSIALSCQGCVAGAIVNAAGFPVNVQPNHDLRFAFFAAVGRADFNYPEFVQLRRTLRDGRAPYRIGVYEGAHGWAPSEVWLEALDWMELQAMLAGVMPRDPSRIRAALDADMQRAHLLESKQNWLDALHEYESVVRDFDGVLDVSTARSRVAELAKNKAVKAAEKQEMSDIASQGRLTAAPSAKLQEILNENVSPSELMELRDKFIDLKNEAARSRQGQRSLVVNRALASLVVQAFECGQRSLEQKDFQRALTFFDLAAAGSPDPGWSHFHRSRAFAVAGDKKNMLSELKLCLAGEIHDRDALQMPEFEKYRLLPEFQALEAQWKAKAQP
jgi:hypothetical protein